MCGKLRERVDEEESDAAGVLGGLLRVAAVAVEVGVIGVCSEAAGKKNEDGIDEREAGGAGCGGPAAAAPDAALPCRLTRARFSIRFRRDSFIK